MSKYNVIEDRDAILEETVNHMEEEIRILHYELGEVKRNRECVSGTSSRTSPRNQMDCSCWGGGEPGAKQYQDTKMELDRLKESHRLLKEEVEDYKVNAEDMTSQMEDYRAKYLQAQQLSEEQQTQLDKLKRDNLKVTEKVDQELQRVKGVFQEKIQSLSPLPYMLESTQLKCQDVHQAKLALDKSVQSLTFELVEIKDHEKQLLDELDNVFDIQKTVHDENSLLLAEIDNLEVQYNQLLVENDRLKATVVSQQSMKQSLEQKVVESGFNNKKYEEAQEECSRQLVRSKERNEMQKKLLQDRMAMVEDELTQSKAATTAALANKEGIRKQMQLQINLLLERFREAESEIEILRDNVKCLKFSYKHYIESDLTPANNDCCPCSNPCHCSCQNT